MSLAGFSASALANPVKASVVDEGTYEVGEIVQVYDAPEQVDGKRKAAKSYTHLETTLRVEARLGVSFGYRYRIEGLSTWWGTDIEMRIQHPPLVDTRGQERRESKARFTTHPKDGVFSSEIIVRHPTPEEDIAGTWTLQILADDAPLLTRKFELVAPAD